jgi:CheY-like chemotaxis protein
VGTKPLIRVLVVEDEGITAKALTEVLRELGYDVVGVAVSGWEALEMTIALEPNIVLMDIKLKGDMDGIAAAQRIQTPLNVPVIYLTAYSDEETVRRVVHSRAYGYIVKPFSAGRIQDAITKALYEHRARKGKKDRGTGGR